MIKCIKTEWKPTIQLRDECIYYGMTQQCRELLEKISKTPTRELKKVSLRYSPDQKKNQYCFRRMALPPIQQKQMKTIKYIGEYQSKLGILTRKEELPEKMRKKCLSVPHSESYYQSEYIINQYVKPHKLGEKK